MVCWLQYLSVAFFNCFNDRAVLVKRAQRSVLLCSRLAAASLVRCLSGSLREYVQNRNHSDRRASPISFDLFRLRVCG